MARARAAPRPPTARAITAAPRTGGLTGAKNGKSRSEWPPSPRKKSKQLKGWGGRLSASGSSSLGFHGQPQGDESRADTKRAPVALILGKQAVHPRRRAASQSRGPASAPAARAGLARNAGALQMERRGASPQPGRSAAPPRAPGPEQSGAPRPQRPPAAAPSPSSPAPGRRPGAARATAATRSRRGRGAEPDTHPAAGLLDPERSPSAASSPPPSAPRPPHPGKGGGG